jgi:hypothetical protein
MLSIDTIGELVKLNPIDSRILNEKTQYDLIKLCEFKEKFGFKLIYRASRDGFGARDFHRLCDNHERTITLIRSSDNFIFGGYASQVWDTSNSWKKNVDEFVFSLKNPSNKLLYKYVGAKGKDAIKCDPLCGPIFGQLNSEELLIRDNSDNRTDNFVKCGNVYSITERFTKTENFCVSELEVFSLSIINDPQSIIPVFKITTD